MLMEAKVATLMSFGMRGSQDYGLDYHDGLGHLQHGCVSSASSLCGGIKLWRLAIMEFKFAILL